MKPSQSILLDPYTTNTETARIAIWAFDILKYPYPKLWLVIVDRLEWDQVHHFAASLGRDDYRIAFVTSTREVSPSLTWKIGPSLPTIHNLERDNFTISQPSALLLARETHRLLSVRPPS